jgi:HD-GYP domain-containing protein (c-di-GMP phosphodiesterase class II)
VADTYEAFTSDRAYRRAGKPKDIIQIMNAEADKIFDASVVTALQKALESKGIL